MTLQGDNPIRTSSEDLLGRDVAAEAFARHVCALDASEGAVVGILGPWGSGKTSFVNLAVEHLVGRARVPVLSFNPWMFSGAQQLVDSFFIELAAQMKLKPELAPVGVQLQNYAETFSGLGWLPLVGPWIERGRQVPKTVGKLLQRRKEGVGRRREELEAALRDQDRPIVVVLDDIDRLTTAEIRDVLKLVRLTASFPNIVYVVAFDRQRVETALTEDRLDGRDYLEKILQVAVDLPSIPESVLTEQVTGALDEAIATATDRTRFTADSWPDVFAEVIRPLVSNMRDVRRYAASVHGTVAELRDEIELVDILGLEAVRVFLPDVAEQMRFSVEGLTEPWDSFGRDDSSRLEAQIERLVSAAAEQADVVRSMVTRLFPAAQRHVGGPSYGADWKARWRKERRVAHEDVFRLYLERVAGESLVAFKFAERAYDLLHDRDELDGYLRSLDPVRLEATIRSLEDYEAEFMAPQVVPTSTVLLNLVPQIPERDRGMLDFGSPVVVTRVVLRLLRTLNGQSEVEAAVREVLPEINSLSEKHELISLVGHRDGAGQKLVSEQVASELERAWRSEVRAASVSELLCERELLMCLYRTVGEAESSEPALVLPPDPELTLAILRSARTDVRSQGVDSRAIRRSARLHFDVLAEIVGGDTALRERVDALKSADVVVPQELIELVDKYLAGWRPDSTLDT